MNHPKHIIAAVVELTILKSKAKAVEERMKELKEQIRDYADPVYQELRKADPELTMLEIPSEKGTCSVIFPKDQPFIIKGADLATAKMVLPPNKWDLTFVTEIGISKTFYDAWTGEPCGFNAKEKSVIKKLIDWKSQTARIEPAKWEDTPKSGTKKVA